MIAAAAAGAGAAELAELAARIRSSQRLVFTVESLEYLRRGGRIGGVGVDQDRGLLAAPGADGRPCL